LPCELSHRRQALAGGKLAVGDQERDPRAYLGGDTERRAAIEPER
jgi:hypothetical protein